MVSIPTTPLLLGLRYIYKKDRVTKSKVEMVLAFFMGLIMLLTAIITFPLAIQSWVVIKELPFESVYVSLFAVGFFLNGLYFLTWGMRNLGVEIEYRFSHPVFRWVMWWTVLMIAVFFLPPHLGGNKVIIIFIIFGILTYKKATSRGFV